MTDKQYLGRLNIAVDLRREGMYALALQVAAGIAAERPEEYAVHHTLGQIYTEIGEFGKALEEHEKAISLLPDWEDDRVKEFQTASLGLAQARLRQGRFDASTWAGWELGRVDISWSPLPGCTPYLGTETDADSLIVQAEGGYGDTFMFMRWLPLLKSVKGVRRLGLMVWSSLEDLLKTTGLFAQPYGIPPVVDDLYVIDRDHIPYDQWRYATSIMSMPAIFQMKSWNDIPGVRGERTPEAHNRRPTRIGFCWRAEENTSPVRTKSLPAGVAGEIARQVSLSGRDPGSVNVYTLSPSKADLYSVSEFDQPEHFWVEPDRMTSWRATAEYIRSMDFVITVDTAVAHLAGLLGIPALVLLPISSCWRWGMPGRKSGPWYGNQLTYYRQTEPLVWDAHRIVQSFMERVR